MIISTRTAAWLAVGAVVALVGGCSRIDRAQRSDSAAPGTAAKGGGSSTTASTPPRWTPPSLDSLGNDPLSRAIRRGVALMLHTRDSLPTHDPGTLNCTSCHLDAGRHPGAVPLFGVHGIYPQYNARADVVASMEDRINFCFVRSLAGSKIPDDSPEMHDFEAYFAFLSRGVPSGTEPLPGKLPAMPPLHGDSATGGAIYAGRCVRCHGPDGSGTAAAPALWGATSFSVGASMARVERSASFIRRNMPFDSAGTLTDQQAFDLAAYVTSHPRPDMPDKNRDWPRGDAPADVPYATAKHTASRPPLLLPRKAAPGGNRT